MLDIKCLLLVFLVTLIWTLDGAQVFRDHFEDLEKLTSNELDFGQIVLLISVACLDLLVLVLFLHEFEPRTHVAELLKDIRVHLLVFYSLAIRPAANNALA